MMSSFFTASKSSKAAGQAYIERLKLSVTDRDAPVSKKAASAQLAAVREWWEDGDFTPDRAACLAYLRELAIGVPPA